MKYLILFIVLLISASAFALPTCSKNGTKIIYTNGVLTSRDEANIALKRILSLKDSKNFNIISSIDKNGITDPIVAYNYTEGPAQDILEAGVQRLPKSYLNALRVTSPYDAYSHFLSGDLIQTISNDIINSIKDAQLQIILTLADGYFNSAKYEQTLNEGVPYYLSAFQNKQKILAISHSQGSLFMNDFYNLIPESDYKRKFYSGFQIASVLRTEMSSHFGYATNSKDEVVNAVKLSIGALSANLDTPFIISTDGLSDLFINHGILSTYLYDTSLKEQVIDKLIKTAQLLESNCNKAVIKVAEQKGLKLVFDSTDPDDKDVTDLTYEWNFGEGSIIQTKSKTIPHTFSKSGLYTISLKTINNDDDTDSKHIVVQVIAPPKAIINYTKNNLVVNFDSTDPEDPNASELTYSWDFGDGQNANTNSKTFSHTYAQAGTYNVSLTVTDTYGASDTTNVSFILQSDDVIVTFCNIGNQTSDMVFSVNNNEPFTLHHEGTLGRPLEYNYCECKQVSLPKNQPISVHIDGEVAPIPGINKMTVIPLDQTFYPYYDFLDSLAFFSKVDPEESHSIIYTITKYYDPRLCPNPLYK